MVLWDKSMMAICVPNCNSASCYAENDIIVLEIFAGSANEILP